jgi:DNA transformation protein and related proteins
MASRREIVDYICEQMAGAGDIRAKRMFGEYGVYCDGIFIGVICNDTLFVKPTPAGDAIAEGLDRVPPYRGAKPSIEVPEERVEDQGWLAGLIQATRDGLSTRSR